MHTISPGRALAGLTNRVLAIVWRVGYLLPYGSVRAIEILILWRDRIRQRRLLASMDDRMRADIGLSRTEIAREVEKPFWSP